MLSETLDQQKDMRRLLRELYIPEGLAQNLHG